jgi:hypothetical protein
MDQVVGSRHAGTRHVDSLFAPVEGAGRCCRPGSQAASAQWRPPSLAFDLAFEASLRQQLCRRLGAGHGGG